MNEYSRLNAPPPGGTTWKCEQCGRELSGIAIPRRSLIHMHHSSTGEAMHSRCKSCGMTLCSSCVEMQKPSEMLPDREALCPRCGWPINDGPVMVPPGNAKAMAGIEEAALSGGAVYNYKKDLRSWAGWLIFWVIINTGMAVWGMQGEGETLSEDDMAGLCVMGSCIGLFDMFILISAIICLVQKTPWPGFFIIFALYLISVGLINLTAGTGWLVLGVIQLFIAVKLFVNWGQYRNARRSSIGY